MLSCAESIMGTQARLIMTEYIDIDRVPSILKNAEISRNGITRDFMLFLSIPRSERL
jgi:hypothetical protein